MTAVTSIDKKPSDVEDVLKRFPLIGRYQVQALVFIALSYATNSLYCNNFVFSAEQIGYRCKDENYNSTSCWNNEIDAQTCKEWVYDNPNSFVGEFQLACQEWKRTLVGSMHSFGYMVGLLFVGPLSDRLGRKPVAVVTGVLGGILGLARSFTYDYWLYIALEFLEGAIGDICSPIYMIAIEMVSNERRVLFQQLCSLGYMTGSLLLPLAAYLFPYWRTFLRVIYTPALFFFLYTFFLDESPRWLISKGKREQAVTILQKAAAKNKIKLDKNLLDKLSCEEDKGISFVALLKKTFSSGALLKRFFVCLSWWTTSTFVNYGMSINSVSLQGNKYVNYALTAVVDLPGTIVITYVLMRYKRKFPLIFSFVLTSILCLTQPFVPKDLAWLSILLYMAGKLMSSAFFGITYMYTSELFPTYTRNSMHALCSSLGRVGSIIAPQTPLLTQYWSGLPSIIFGAASLLAGMVTFLVPDTADDSLPDTVKQAEALGTKQQANKNQKDIPFVIPTRINDARS